MGKICNLWPSQKYAHFALLLGSFTVGLFNSALGRFLSVDPLRGSYPWYTPYQFAGNTPIQAIDLDGLEEYKITYWLANRQLTGLSIEIINPDADLVFDRRFQSSPTNLPFGKTIRHSRSYIPNNSQLFYENEWFKVLRYQDLLQNALNNSEPSEPFNIAIPFRIATSYGNIPLIETIPLTPLPIPLARIDRNFARKLNEMALKNRTEKFDNFEVLWKIRNQGSGSTASMIQRSNQMLYLR